MITTPFRPALAALFLLAASAGAPALAQALPGTTTTETPAAPAEKDALGRDTPQGLVAGLIGALSADRL